MTIYKRPDEDDTEALARGDLVELEAQAIHDSDRHLERFATCKVGCWVAAEIAVNDAVYSGNLVPVLD